MTWWHVCSLYICLCWNVCTHILVQLKKEGNIELPVLCSAGFELSLGSAYFKCWPYKFKTENSTGTWHWLMKQSKSVLPQHSVSSVSSVCGSWVTFSFVSPVLIRLHPVQKLKPRKSALTWHSLAASWTFEISSSSQPGNDSETSWSSSTRTRLCHSPVTWHVVFQNVLMGSHGLSKSTVEQNRHVRVREAACWNSDSAAGNLDLPPLPPHQKRIRNLHPKSRFCLPFLIVSCFQTFGGFQNVSVPRSTNLALDFSGSQALDFDLQRSVFAFQKRRSDATSKNVQQTFRESSGNGKKIEKVKKDSGQTYSSFHRCEKMFSELIPGLWWLRLRLHNSSLAAFCLAPQDQKGKCAVKIYQNLEWKSMDI